MITLLSQRKWKHIRETKISGWFSRLKNRKKRACRKTIVVEQELEQSELKSLMKEFAKEFKSELDDIYDSQKPQ